MNSIEVIKENLIPIFSNNDVSEAILFGSYAKNCMTEKSDLDLVIDFKGDFDGFTFYGIKAAIEEQLGIEVDLFAKFDILPGQRLEKEISETGVIIYGG